MVEKVIISLDRVLKKAQMYRSMVEAAKDMGVSKQAIEYAVKKGGSCAGKKWKKSHRFLLVKANGKFAVCNKDGNNYIDLGTPRVFKGREIDKIVDITIPMWEATFEGNE